MLWCIINGEKEESKKGVTTFFNGGLQNVVLISQVYLGSSHLLKNGCKIIKKAYQLRMRRNIFETHTTFFHSIWLSNRWYDPYILSLLRRNSFAFFRPWAPVFIRSLRSVYFSLFFRALRFISDLCFYFFLRLLGLALELSKMTMMHDQVLLQEEPLHFFSIFLIPAVWRYGIWKKIFKLEKSSQFSLLTKDIHCSTYIHLTQNAISVSNIESFSTYFKRNTNTDQMFSSQPFSDKLMVLCRSLDNQNKQKDGCNNHNVFSFLTKIDALESLSLGTKLGLFCSLMVFQWFCIDQEMISYATLRSFGNQCAPRRSFKSHRYHFG